jgi:signal transduction histidine kinase
VVVSFHPGERDGEWPLTRAVGLVLPAVVHAPVRKLQPACIYIYIDVYIGYIYRIYIYI